jgi:hypothetical protein
VLKERKKEKRKKGRKTQETRQRGKNIEIINFKLYNKLSLTLWAVLPANRIAQKIQWAGYKYYTTTDNDIAYFQVKYVILPAVLNTA